MMYIFSVAVLIGMFGSAKAQCAAAYTPDGGAVQLDTCIFGVYMISCDDNGDAFETVYTDNIFDGGSDCTGTSYNSAVNASEYTVVCDAEPCEFASASTCYNADGSDGCDGDDAQCFDIPFVLDVCQVYTDENTSEVSSSMTTCGSEGVMVGYYDDATCTSGFTIPYSSILGEAEECLTLTGCEDYDGGDEEPTTTYTRGIECPTGVLNVVLEEGVEAPYIPLGLCNKFDYGVLSVYSSYECNSDGVVTQYTYGSNGCSGNPTSETILDFGDETEFVASCDDDSVECKYVRFNVYTTDDDGNCPTDGGISYEQASLVGDCITFNSTVSYMQSCTDTTATRNRYSNADCSGDAVEIESILEDFSECGGSVVECYMEEPDIPDGNNSAGFNIKVGLVMVAALCNFLFL